jgi:hypothetical protein
MSGTKFRASIVSVVSMSLFISPTISLNSTLKSVCSFSTAAVVAWMPEAGCIGLFAQLRTNHYWLKSYRKKIGYAEEDKCKSQKIGSKEESLSIMPGGKLQTSTAGKSSRTKNGNSASHTPNVTVTNTEASNTNDKSKKEKWNRAEPNTGLCGRISKIYPKGRCNRLNHSL